MGDGVIVTVQLLIVLAAVAVNVAIIWFVVAMVAMVKKACRAKAAASAADEDRPGDKFFEKALGVQRMYTGKIINVDLVDIELPDGRKAKREVVRHGNAVAVLAKRPDGKFVFVKQYRKAAEEALVEVIAGGLEKDEDPMEGAKRETAEETGYDVASIKFLTTIICTPGYCEERIHIYYAELAEGQHDQDQDADENVFPVVMTAEEVEDGIRKGTIFDSKTLSAWLAYKLA